MAPIPDHREQHTRVLVQVPGRVPIRPPVATDDGHDGHDGRILRPLAPPCAKPTDYGVLWRTQPRGRPICPPPVRPQKTTDFGGLWRIEKLPDNLTETGSTMPDWGS